MASLRFDCPFTRERFPDFLISWGGVRGAYVVVEHAAEGFEFEGREGVAPHRKR